MRKGLICLVAAVALAAFSLPASAGVGLADLQASGFYHGFAILSNFHDAGGGPSLRNSDEEQTNAYIQQRFRVKWTFGSENVKAVWYLESDMRWGDSAGNTDGGAGRNFGGALGADKVQTETKNIYVWFKVPNTSIQAKFGLQGVKDDYSGVFSAGNDMGAITLSGKYAPVSYRFVFAKLYENVVQNSDDGTLWMIGAKFSPTKKVKLGLNFYFLQDDTGKPGTAGSARLNTMGPMYPTDNYSLKIYMPGLTAEAKLGPVKVGGWFFYQTGKFERTNGLPDQDVSAFALNAHADVAVGPGKVHVEGLYLSGGDGSGTAPDYEAPITLGDFQQNASPGGYSGYSKLHTVILLPNYHMATVSQCLIGCSGGEYGDSPGNGGRGIWAIGGRYSQKITKKVKGEVNIVHMEATDILVTDFAGRDKDMGTEFNGTLAYSPYKGLTLEGTAAYVALGDFVADDATSDFVNPWTTYLRVAYSY